MPCSFGMTLVMMPIFIHIGTSTPMRSTRSPTLNDGMAHDKQTTDHVRIGKFSIKPLLEDFHLIGRERPKFGQSCPSDLTQRDC